MHRIIADGLNLPNTVLVRRELRDVFHQQLHDFDVTLSKGSHEAADFAMVLTVDIGIFLDELLDYFQMTTIAGQPHGRGALFILGLHISATETRVKLINYLYRIQVEALKASAH